MIVGCRRICCPSYLNIKQNYVFIAKQRGCRFSGRLGGDGRTYLIGDYSKLLRLMGISAESEESRTTPFVGNECKSPACSQDVGKIGWQINFQFHVSIGA